MYCYLESTTNPSGKPGAPEFKPGGKPSGLFNLRGEVGDNDDPKTFKKRMGMGKPPLRAIFTEEMVGEKGVPLKILEKFEVKLDSWEGDAQTEAEPA